MTSRQAPYVGPRPFQPGEDQIFHGRESEANALMSLIIAHPTVLLYSQSGAGKTSLLNAKVRKQLEERGAEVLGSARVSGSLPPEVSPHEIQNIFVYNGLMTLQPDDSSQRSFTGNTSFSDYLKSLPRSERPGGGLVQRVVIFDQFEEIFTASQERWTDREGFFEQVATALDDDPQLCVVFAMREEYLASMDNYVSILPERLRTRFHLERLRAKAALEAVIKPLADTSRRFAAGVAEQLVENLLRVQVRTESGLHTVTGEFVEPVQLQVVCQNLWDSLNADVDLIDEKFIESCGDVDRALTVYYENCLRTVIEQKAINEAALRRWFDTKLITPDGFRSIVYKEEHNTANLPNPVVALVEELRLVRVETRGGAYWYELTHDRFIAPISESNRRWFAEQSEFGRLLETKAREWHQQKLDKDLLKGSHLEEATGWAQSAEAQAFGVTDSMKEYVQWSKNAASKARNRMWRRVGIGLVLLLLTTTGLLGWALWERSKAAEARLIERSDVASTMTDRGKHVDALVWGLKAVEPGLLNERQPPAEALASLRKVLRAVGGVVWQRGLPKPAKVVIAPNGSLVLTEDNDQFSLWKIDTGTLVFTKKTRGEPIRDRGAASKVSARTLISLEASFTPGGTSVVARYNWRKTDGDEDPFDVNRDITTEILDLNGNGRSKINGQLRTNDKVFFSADDSAAVVTTAGEIRVLDGTTGNLLKSLRTTRGEVSSIVFSPSGKHFIQVSGSTLILRAMDQLDHPLTQIKLGQAEDAQVVFADDGKFFAVHEDYSFELDKAVLKVFDSQTGKKVATMDYPQSGFSALTLRFVLADSSILIVDLESRGPMLTRSVSAQIWDFGKTSLTPYKEEYFALAGSEPFLSFDRIEEPTAVRVIDPVTQQVRSEFHGLSTKVESVTISRDFMTAVTLDKDNLMQVWRAGNFSDDVDRMTTQELYARACTRIRFQEQEFLSVKHLCQRFLT